MISPDERALALISGTCGISGVLAYQHFWRVRIRLFTIHLRFLAPCGASSPRVSAAPKGWAAPPAAAALASRGAPAARAWREAHTRSRPARRNQAPTAKQKLRIVILGFGTW
jgi:hypothetical protein